mmetsp:Transcript_30242/g.93311  ORF Transcript_30242/g.93311 Transcript_30242/m.93311 type:complete len:923 (+) Transcript_30242:180-2948(+)
MSPRGPKGLRSADQGARSMPLVGAPHRCGKDKPSHLLGSARAATRLVRFVRLVPVVVLLLGGERAEVGLVLHRVHLGDEVDLLALPRVPLEEGLLRVVVVHQARVEVVVRLLHRVQVVGLRVRARQVEALDDEGDLLADLDHVVPLVVAAAVGPPQDERLVDRVDVVLHADLAQARHVLERVPRRHAVVVGARGDDHARVAHARVEVVVRVVLHEVVEVLAVVQRVAPVLALRQGQREVGVHHGVHDVEEGGAQQRHVEELVAVHVHGRGDGHRARRVARDDELVGRREPLVDEELAARHEVVDRVHLVAALARLGPPGLLAAAADVRKGDDPAAADHPQVRHRLEVQVGRLAVGAVDVQEAHARRVGGGVVLGDLVDEEVALLADGDGDLLAVVGRDGVLVHVIGPHVVPRREHLVRAHRVQRQRRHALHRLGAVRRLEAVDALARRLRDGREEEVEGVLVVVLVEPGRELAHRREVQQDVLLAVARLVHAVADVDDAQVLRALVPVDVLEDDHVRLEDVDVGDLPVGTVRDEVLPSLEGAPLVEHHLDAGVHDLVVGRVVARDHDEVSVVVLEPPPRLLARHLDVLLALEERLQLVRDLGVRGGHHHDGAARLGVARNDHELGVLRPADVDEVVLVVVAVDLLWLAEDAGAQLEAHHAVRAVQIVALGVVERLAGAELDGDDVRRPDHVEQRRVVGGAHVADVPVAALDRERVRDVLAGVGDAADADVASRVPEAALQLVRVDQFVTKQVTLPRALAVEADVGLLSLERARVVDVLADALLALVEARLARRRDGARLDLEHHAVLQRTVVEAPVERRHEAALAADVAARLGAVQVFHVLELVGERPPGDGEFLRLRQREGAVVVHVHEAVAAQPRRDVVDQAPQHAADDVGAGVHLVGLRLPDVPLRHVHHLREWHTACG